MENLLDKIAHFISAGGVLAIIAMLLNQHTVWVRLKDRVNSLWRKHCHETGEDFIPLEKRN